MRTVIGIGVAGAAGALARYGLEGLVSQRTSTAFPWGTFIVNVSGCLVMGVAMTLLTERLVANPQWRFLIPIGFIGAYTTFSTYEYEMLRLLELGQAAGAVTYLLASNLLGFCAVAMGAWLGRRM